MYSLNTKNSLKGLSAIGPMQTIVKNPSKKLLNYNAVCDRYTSLVIFAYFLDKMCNFFVLQRIFSCSDSF